MSDTKRIIAVKAHGRIRLLNGLEARLRLLFTGRKFLAESLPAGQLSRKHTRPWETIATYTPKSPMRFRFFWPASLLLPLWLIVYYSYNRWHSFTLNHCSR